jgi:hypothetical protein
MEKIKSKEEILEGLEDLKRYLFGKKNVEQFDLVQDTINLIIHSQFQTQVSDEEEILKRFKATDSGGAGELTNREKILYGISLDVMKSIRSQQSSVVDGWNRAELEKLLTAFYVADTPKIQEFLDNYKPNR